MEGWPIGELSVSSAPAFCSPSLSLFLGALTCPHLRRLLGITSLFLYSILTDRAFSISTEGSPFDLVFDSAGLMDWSQRFRLGSTSPHALYDNKTLERSSAGFHDMWAEDLDPFFSKFAGNEHEWTRVSLSRSTLASRLSLTFYLWEFLVRDLQPWCGLPVLSLPRGRAEARRAGS